MVGSVNKGTGFFGGGGGWNYMSRYEQQQYSLAHNTSQIFSMNENGQMQMTTGHIEFGNDGTEYVVSDDGQFVHSSDLTNHPVVNGQPGSWAYSVTKPYNPDPNNCGNQAFTAQMDEVYTWKADNSGVNAGGWKMAAVGIVGVVGAASAIETFGASLAASLLITNLILNPNLEGTHTTFQPHFENPINRTPQGFDNQDDFPNGSWGKWIGWGTIIGWGGYRVIDEYKEHIKNIMPPNIAPRDKTNVYLYPH